MSTTTEHLHKLYDLLVDLQTCPRTAEHSVRFMVDRSEHISNMTSESHTGPVLTNAELYRTAKSGSGKYCRTLETLSKKKRAC